MTEPSKSEVFMARPRILLADDHQLVLERLKMLLQARFEIVGVARDGAEMVSRAASLLPELIVADISMPGLSGIEALQRLRQTGKEFKVVFLTVHTEPEFVEACLAAGGMGYVTKSHMKTDLIPAIDAALTGRKYISPMSPTRH
jgi:DNA-binding NarL/FixJ family response regulator